MRRASVALLVVLFLSVLTLVGVKSFADAATTSDCVTVADCIAHAQADLARAAELASPSTTVATTVAPTVAPTTQASTTTRATTTTTKSTTAGVCPTTDTPSTYSGTRLTFAQAAQAGYAAGFTTQAQLETMVAIGAAESSLDVRARNWHPEYGCRPATDIIGVQGPNSVWDSTHARQLNSDRGAWQISSRWWPAVTDAQADNPTTAALAFRAIYTQGRGFAEWDTYNNGAYRNRLTTALRDAVAAVIANGG